jgi:hypothetical protein
MGKMIFYVTAIVMIELLLLITGQLCTTESGTQVCGLGSIIFKAVLNFQDLTFGQFFNELIGDVSTFFTSTTGIGALVAAAGVTIGAFLLTSSDIRLFIPIAFTLALIVSDFVFLFNNLGINVIAASLILIPLGMSFTIVVIDWLRGKD